MKYSTIQQVSKTKAAKQTQSPTLRLWRWGRDRFNTGYKIFTIAFHKRFDCYIFYYPTNSCIPKHKDPSFGYKHYRLNFVVKAPKKGGEFNCKRIIFNFKNRIYIFRADKNYHSANTILEGSRILLSFGIRL